MSIRTKLLLIMTALLGAFAVSFFLLRLKEGHAIREDVQKMVKEIAENLVHETMPQGLLSPRDRADYSSSLRNDNVVIHMEFGSTTWSLFVERIPSPLRLGDDLSAMEFVGRGGGELSSPAALRHRDEVLPALTELLHETTDPITKARMASLRRELFIAGGVSLLGLVMIYLIAGRLSGPIKDLTGKMELVARGDLDVKVKPTTQGEVRQMSLAFNSMVDSLREKRELEQSVFRAERLTAMGNLAAGVAHDIRNPLNTIGLTLSHLRDNFVPADSQQQGAYLRHVDDVKKELARLNELVRNFLSLAHPDRGEKAWCDLREVVGDCLRLFSKEAEAKGVTIETDLHDAEPLLVNPRQIQGAITNVVINGLRAMESEGGRMVLSLRNRPAAGHESRGPESEVVLRIRDDGCGIDADDLEKIFLPYFTTHADGTGLGLPVARSAVEANGGRMEVRSQPGQGTEVAIVLPVCPIDSDSPAAPAEEGIA